MLVYARRLHASVCQEATCQCMLGGCMLVYSRSFNASVCQEATCQCMLGGYMLVYACQCIPEASMLVYARRLHASVCQEARGCLTATASRICLMTCAASRSLQYPRSTILVHRHMILQQYYSSTIWGTTDSTTTSTTLVLQLVLQIVLQLVLQIVLQLHLVLQQYNCKQYQLIILILANIVLIVIVLIVKLLHLDATISFMYISMRDFQKYIYTSGFATQSLLITSYFCDDH